MKQWNFLFGTLVTLVLVLSRVQCRHLRRTLCEGGREDGDKWFDGCQWCVCQPGGPVCSPRDCSENVARVPPCGTLGSRWRDGCYECTCGISGIECQADPACVSRMPTGFGGQTVFLLGGKCQQKKDYRCICGVDGVPSCSAEVIDRSAYTSTRIVLNLTNRFSHPAHPRRHDSKHIIFHENDLIRSRSKRRADNHHALRAFQRSQRRYVNWNNYADSGSSLGGYAFPESVNKKGRYQKARHPKHSRRQENYLQDQTINNREIIFSQFGNSHSLTAVPMPSLLVATDNYCRFGQRWYGGSLRCYCDVSGAVTCGDPSFVASRIDGFSVEKTPCEAEHVWEEEETCLSCECHFSSLVMCQRSAMCPLPFLISGRKGGNQKPAHHGDDVIIDIGDDDDMPGVVLDGSGEHSKTADEEQTDPTRKDEELIVVSRDDVIDIDLNPKSDIVLELDGEDVTVQFDGGAQNKRRAETTKSPKISAVVTGRTRARYPMRTGGRCGRPGLKLMRGCRWCICTQKKLWSCDKSRCSKFPSPPPRISYNTTPRRNDGRPTVRPMQRPPPFTGVPRRYPITPSTTKNVLCDGKFKPGTTYYRKCNRCECTHVGAKCTAMACP